MWRHVQVLWMGAVLCRGPRVAAAVPPVMGLGGERRFEQNHRVLNRVRWSSLQGAKILLGLLPGQSHKKLPKINYLVF